MVSKSISYVTLPATAFESRLPFDPRCGMPELAFRIAGTTTLSPRERILILLIDIHDRGEGYVASETTLAAKMPCTIRDIQTLCSRGLVRKGVAA